MMPKKWMVFLLCAFICINLCPKTVTGEIQNEQPPALTCKSAIVIEANSHRVLFSKNPYEKLPMASTTKIMTAILALEYGKLDEIVKIPKEAAGVPGSSLYLRTNQKISLKDLVYGLLISSGNDAAVALALYVSKDVDTFVDAMNHKAQALGCFNTHFANPNGLPAENHYTTAYDLSVIAAYAMQSEQFRAIVRSKSATIKDYQSGESHDIYSKNKFMLSFPGGNGIKTGYTDAAGKCFVSGAKQNGMQLIGVVLNAADKFQESSDMMSYVFAHYKLVKILDKGHYLGTVSIQEGKDDTMKLYADKTIYLPVNKDNSEKPVIAVNLKNEYMAPIQKGALIGEYHIRIGKDEIIKRNLYAAYKVEERKSLKGFMKYLKNITFIPEK